MPAEPPDPPATPAPLPRGNDPIAVAVAFMAAQDGGPERVLRTHVPDVHDDCQRCRMRLHPVRWPCAPAIIALAARDAQSATFAPADPDPRARPT